MTDTFFSGDDATAAPQTPMSEPAPVSQAPAAAPAAATRTAFDDNLDDFLGRDLLSEMAPPEPAAPPATGTEPAPAAQPATPGVAPAAPAGAPPSPAPQPAPANEGTPSATTTQPAPAGETANEEVDSDLLLAMMGIGEPTATPASTTTPSTPAPAPATPADDEVPMPFTTAMQLPQQMVTALFESEDPVQRSQALTGLMAALGNACVGYMEQRISAHHAPRLAQQFEAAQTARTSAQAVHQHFYGAYPELAAHKQLVTKAGQTYLAKNPGKTYDENTAKEIAKLAKAAAKQLGLSLPAATGAPAPAAPAAPVPPRAPATPYVAGNASPGGNLETPLDPNDAGSIFEQMAGVWG